jgi:hypothetical protein
VWQARHILEICSKEDVLMQWKNLQSYLKQENKIAYFEERGMWTEANQARLPPRLLCLPQAATASCLPQLPPCLALPACLPQLPACHSCLLAAAAAAVALLQLRASIDKYPNQTPFGIGVMIGCSDSLKRRSQGPSKRAAHLRTAIGFKVRGQSYRRRPSGSEHPWQRCHGGGD